MNSKIKIAAFLVTAALLLTFAPLGAQETELGVVSSAFHATDYAEAAGLGGVTGDVTFDSANAYIFINLHPNGAELPEGTVLEGWLVDAGRFTGPSQSNASVADQGYGPPFGNLAFDVLVSAAPYALSTGVLQLDTEGNWSLDFHVPNYNFSPYDGVVITAESDGNTGDWDPRPGAPFFSAGMNPMYADLQPVEMEVFAMVGPAGIDSDVTVTDELVGIATAEPTPLAANANLAMAVAGATLYHSQLGAFIDLTIYLSDNSGPEGCLVLEGWVVDAGLLGGPGTSNANDGDEALGPPSAISRWSAWTPRSRPRPTRSAPASPPTTETARSAQVSSSPATTSTPTMPSWSRWKAIATTMASTRARARQCCSA